MAVYLSEPIHPESYALLKSEAEIVEDFSVPQKIEGLITRNIKVDKVLMDQLPNLKVIGIHGSGCDDVDIEEAKKRHIQVFNAPNQNSVSVAEMIVMFMLALSRQLIKAEHDYTSQTICNLAPSSLMGQELSGKTVGFIGVGAIAKQAIGILKAGFKMNVLGYSRHLDQTAANALSITPCADLISLLSQSDYVCLCLPLNEETYHLIGEKELEVMKPTAFLINTARGAIIDEEALYLALKEKKIAGAASDVLTHEPHFSKLMLLENMIITPHLGANTNEALKRVGDLCVSQMIDALHHRPIAFEVNE